MECFTLLVIPYWHIVYQDHIDQNTFINCVLMALEKYLQGVR